MLRGLAHRLLTLAVLLHVQVVRGLVSRDRKLSLVLASPTVWLPSEVESGIDLLFCFVGKGTWEWLASGKMSKH